MHSNTKMLVGGAVLALLVATVAATGPEGCYDTSSHKCDCEVLQEKCTKVWTPQCKCASGTGGKIDIKCPWSKPTGGRYGCPAFPDNVTGTTGQHMEMVINAGSDVMLLKDAATYDACDVSSATSLQGKRAKGAVNFRYTFNIPDTYYLSTGADGACAAGQKIKVIITGAKAADKNGALAEVIFAPSAHANPGQDDDFTAFGKGVFHDKAYDDELHKPCKEAHCLDRKTSRGSCYYAGEDFHIGHAVFCDVSEEECCGYVGCKDKKNRGKFANGTSHGYYYYAPGYVSGGACCHCLAGCDRTRENATKATRTGGVCKYRDVTTDTCQRDEDKDSMKTDTIGFLQCAFPQDKTANDAVVREIVMKAPPPSAAETSAAAPGAPRGAGLFSSAAFVLVVLPLFATAFMA